MSGYRPYATPTALVQVIRGWRQRNLPDSVTPQYIQSAFGISAAMASRVLKGLLFLGFVGGYGQPEAKLESLVRSASDGEFQRHLRTAIEIAYRDILKAAHPSQSAFHQIVAAFRPYEPASQHYRMAVLLIGLCREAGIAVQQEIRLPRQQPRERATNSSDNTSEAEVLDSAPAQRSPALWGLIRDLPDPGSVFPLDKRGAWLESMRAALAYTYAEPEDETGPHLLKTPPPRPPSAEEAEGR